MGKFYIHVHDQSHMNRKISVVDVNKISGLVWNSIQQTCCIQWTSITCLTNAFLEVLGEFYNQPKLNQSTIPGGTWFCFTSFFPVGHYNMDVH